MVSPSKGDCALLQGKSEIAHTIEMHWATDTGFKCLFCRKGEGREGWRSRVLSQGSPRRFPLPLPPNSKAHDYIGASDKHQQKGGKFWRFFCFQKSTHFPLLNDPYNNLNFLLFLLYGNCLHGKTKLCNSTHVCKTCFSLCLVPLETWVVSACLIFTLPPSTGIQTWLLSKVTSMHRCFTCLNWAF